MRKGQSYGNGASISNGPVPVGLRGWEMAELRASQVTFWTVQP